MHGSFKNFCPKGIVGSTPTEGTMFIEDCPETRHCLRSVKEAREEFVRKFGSYEFHDDDPFLIQLEQELEMYKDWIQVRKRKDHCSCSQNPRR